MLASKPVWNQALQIFYCRLESDNISNFLKKIETESAVLEAQTKMKLKSKLTLFKSFMPKRRLVSD